MTALLFWTVGWFGLGSALGFRIAMRRLRRWVDAAELRLGNLNEEISALDLRMRR